MQYWQCPGVKPIAATGKAVSIFDTITFGIHRGKTVLAVARTSADWLLWAHNTVEYFTLTDEALMLVDYHVSMQGKHANND